MSMSVGAYNSQRIRENPLYMEHKKILAENVYVCTQECGVYILSIFIDVLYNIYNFQIEIE